MLCQDTVCSVTSIHALSILYTLGSVNNPDDVNTLHALPKGTVAKSVEHWTHMWEIVGSYAGRVKPMAYKIETCCFLAKCLALLG